MESNVLYSIIDFYIKDRYTFNRCSGEGFKKRGCHRILSGILEPLLRRGENSTITTIYPCPLCKQPGLFYVFVLPSIKQIFFVRLNYYSNEALTTFSALTRADKSSNLLL